MAGSLQAAAQLRPARQQQRQQQAQRTRELPATLQPLHTMGAAAAAGPFTTAAAADVAPRATPAAAAVGASAAPPASPAAAKAAAAPLDTLASEEQQLDLRFVPPSPRPPAPAPAGPEQPLQTLESEEQQLDLRFVPPSPRQPTAGPSAAPSRRLAKCDSAFLTRPAEGAKPGRQESAALPSAPAATRSLMAPPPAPLPPPAPAPAVPDPAEPFWEPQPRSGPAGYGSAARSAARGRQSGGSDYSDPATIAWQSMATPAAATVRYPALYQAHQAAQPRGGGGGGGGWEPPPAAGWQPGAGPAPFAGQQVRLASMMGGQGTAGINRMHARCMPCSLLCSLLLGVHVPRLRASHPRPLSWPSPLAALRRRRSRSSAGAAPGTPAAPLGAETSTTSCGWQVGWLRLRLCPCCSTLLRGASALSLAACLYIVTHRAALCRG